MSMFKKWFKTPSPKDAVHAKNADHTKEISRDSGVDSIATGTETPADAETSKIEMAVSAAVGVVVLVGSLAPFPGASELADLVKKIYEGCKKVQCNRRSAEALAKQCETLLWALQDDSKIKPPETLQQAIDASILVLKEIDNQMVRWSDMGQIRAFLEKDRISDAFKDYYQRIAGVLQVFNIASHMELHHWQAQFELNRQHDMEDLKGGLTDISNKQNILVEIIALNHDEIQHTLATMQEDLRNIAIGSAQHNGLKSNMYDVQQQSGQLLPEYDLRGGEVQLLGRRAVSGTSNFDVFEGLYLGREKCVIKSLRGFRITPASKTRFLREAGIWRAVWKNHGEYILAFYGVYEDEMQQPCMVSPWMKNGTAIEFVIKHEDADRKTMIRRIAEGLRILHSQNPPIVHGQLRGSNVLIDDKFNPLLGEFGLSKIVDEINGEGAFSQSQGIDDTYRWFAPELCTSPGILTPASDVFAFGMTVLELMTGVRPFAEIKRTAEAMFRIQGGFLPRRPTDPTVALRGLDDRLWALLLKCWKTKPSARPTIDEVLADLSNMN